MSSNEPAFLHPEAAIEADVEVGAGSRVWGRATVRRGARIGRECIIGRDAFVDTGVTIGDRCKVQNGALLYHGLSVEDGVFIGPGAILTNDRYPRAINPDGGLADESEWEVSPIHLQRGCSIGASSVVVAGVSVGSFATVGSGAVVTHNVPDYALVVGSPARQIGWVCACGRRLFGENGQPADGGALTGILHCANCARRYAGSPSGISEVGA